MTASRPAAQHRPRAVRVAQRACWMALVQDGNVDAYRALLDDLRVDVTAYLRRRLANAQETDDVYQDVLLALHVSRHTYERGRPVEPWVFAIAGHVLARHVRSAARRKAREVLVDAFVSEPAPATSGPSWAEVREALARLPDRQREAIELLDVAGLPVQVAAARAHTTTGALRVRVHRAYKGLRGLLTTGAR